MVLDRSILGTPAGKMSNCGYKSERWLNGAEEKPRRRHWPGSQTERGHQGRFHLSARPDREMRNAPGFASSGFGRAEKALVPRQDAACFSLRLFAGPPQRLSVASLSAAVPSFGPTSGPARDPDHLPTSKRRRPAHFGPGAGRGRGSPRRIQRDSGFAPCVARPRFQCFTRSAPNSHFLTSPCPSG